MKVSKELRPLIIAIPSPTGSGGDRRSFEILSRARHVGMDPILIVDQNFTDSTDGISHLRKYYDVYTIDKAIYDKIFKKAMFHGKLFLSLLKSIPFYRLLDEADIIVSHHELPWFVFKAFLLHKLSNNVPWTAILQQADLDLGFYKRKSLELLQTTKCLTVSKAIPTEILPYGYPLKYTPLNPPLGVDHELISTVTPSAKRFDAVFFSRLCREKGIFDIPPLWSHVTREVPNAKLCIMGNFEHQKDKRRFFQEIQKLDLCENVIYKGFVDGREKYSIIKESKVLVYPSKADSFSLVVLESLACGIPVIAYDIPAMRLNYPRNLVKLVPKGDFQSLAKKTKEFIRTTSKRETLSQKAKKFTAPFTWENAVKAEKREYLRIIKF